MARFCPLDLPFPPAYDGASLSCECITMATSKPRITITLDPSVHYTLRQLSELQGVSMSSIVSDLLVTVDPVQRRVVETMRFALSLQENARADFASQLERAQEQTAASALPLFELLGGCAPTTLPPHSNTGVTISDKQAVQAAHKSKKPLKTSSCTSSPLRGGRGVE